MLESTGSCPNLKSSPSPLYRGDRSYPNRVRGVYSSWGASPSRSSSHPRLSPRNGFAPFQDGQLGLDLLLLIYYRYTIPSRSGGNVEKIRPLAGALLVLGSCAPLTAQTTKKASFANDVAPILSQKCMQCHGLANPMANLDLKSREGALKGANTAPAIVPGDAARSILYRHVAGQEQPQMPLGGKLSAEEIGVLKAWIDSGAEWDSNVKLTAGAPPVTAATEKKFTDAQRKYWAFQKVVRPAVPSVKAKSWVRTPIDAFILAKLEEKNLKPNPPRIRSRSSAGLIST